LARLAVRGTFSPTGPRRPASARRLPRTLGLRNPLMRALALPAIEFYKRRISPYKGFCCAYRAHLGRFSCSTLGFRAIRMYGVFRGISILRQRLKLCGVAHRRFHQSPASGQRGSAPCDIPCDCGTGPGCDLPSTDCKGLGRYVSCCDGCSCDWPERKKKSGEKYVYIPPSRSRTQRQ